MSGYRDEHEHDVVLGCFTPVQSLWQTFYSRFLRM